MAQNKSALPPDLFSGRALTVAVVIVLAIGGLIPTRILFGPPLTPTPTSDITTERPPPTEEEITVVESSEAPKTETSEPPPTQRPSPDPTEPPTKEATEASQSVVETEAIVEESTEEVTEEAIEEAPSTEEPTETATARPTQEPTTAPQPPVATIVFVQSNNTNHDLGMVSSTGQLIIGSLLQRAAAPAWSPTSNEIAIFIKPGHSIGSEGVWAIDSRGQNPRQIIYRNDIKNITWSPQGDKIAFESTPPGETAKIWVVNSDRLQTRAEMEIQPFAGEQPAWSPDGSKLVIKACLDDCGLWLVNIDGGEPRQITFDSTDSYPNWSPNGQYLTFTSQQRDSDWEIYRLTMQGMTPQGEPVRLTEQTGEDVTPVFGPGSRAIYFRTAAFGTWRINAINIDGTNQRSIREGVGDTREWGLARPTVK